MSDTPRTDAACGWPVGHHGRIECSDLRWSPDGPFIHSVVAREIERENAALRACVDRTGEANDKLVVENAALRADKERLDWLETNGREQVYGPTWRIAWQFGQDVSLRAVIDAARKEAQP